MSTERIFNIFLYFDAGVANDYGVRHHLVTGQDAEKTHFLLSRVDADYPIARRFKLPRQFTPGEWLAAQRYGDVLHYFEEGLQLFRAPTTPVYCVTAIVDGEPKIDLQVGAEPFRGDAVTDQKDRGAMPDYLMRYSDGNHFRFTELIHDDYFGAIRTLFNTKLYVSCAKLLMSCVDTLAFVEYGDTTNNFTRWLDAYVDLPPHGISSDELWEFRNSVLHMTNLASRKVIAGKVSPIMPYVGAAEAVPAFAPDSAKPFNLYGLITAIATGIGQWAESYNTDRDKFLKFIERYDTIISDSRIAWQTRPSSA
jgi:hypothetical protein